MVPEAEVISLSQMTPGQTGRITRLATSNGRVLRKLMALGILPGMTVALIRSTPAYVFQLGQSQFTVDREIAEGIAVEVGAEKEGVNEDTKTHRRRRRWRERKGGE